MIPPADETMALSRNFFLPPASGANTVDANKIQTVRTTISYQARQNKTILKKNIL
jgi:hypothetical protein